MTYNNHMEPSLPEAGVSINKNLHCPLCKSREIGVKETRGGFRNRVEITCMDCGHRAEGWEDLVFPYFGGL